MVPGCEHLRTTVREGVEIEKRVRGMTAGFNVPTFVCDAPGGGGKRHVASYEYYDEENGISVWRAPNVKPGELFLYFDPLHRLSDAAQQRWQDAEQRVAMVEAAIQAVDPRSWQRRTSETGGSTGHPAVIAWWPAAGSLRHTRRVRLGVTCSIKLNRSAISRFPDRADLPTLTLFSEPASMNIATPTGWSKAEMADEIIAMLGDGSSLNLGIGMPTLIAERMPSSKRMFIHSENGVLGVEGRPTTRPFRRP